MIDEYVVADFMMMSEHMAYVEYPSVSSKIAVEPTSADVPALYAKFITEEYKELSEAITSGNDTHIVNEAVDLIWVTLGYMISKGYDIEGAWNALTRANRAKLQKDPSTGKLLRRPDGKILKPADWKPADFSKYVPKPKS